MTYCAHFPLRKMTDDIAYEEFQLYYMGTRAQTAGPCVIRETSMLSVFFSVEAVVLMT